ncbi:hypothetical protein ACWDY7_32200 [Streptomyces calvus]|uniref:Uncharacterized protein n=1 Tax=Streptomyces calvus TaxID=67282 RepID=A0AA40SKG8_9ACTN|nr:hypothetical protein [Streptomyces calvus]MBA8948177.1 hypothetical protein [Streptomyces calvus]GGP84100.1 hypothetical protein GCM10010247_66840 [Streptomyces calvus]
MTTRRLRVALLLATAVPLTAATAAAALRAGHLKFYVDRHRIELTPQPRRSCPDCRGDGGWWVDGANPEMGACGCWANRPTWRIRLLPVPAWPDEPSF